MAERWEEVTPLDNEESTVRMKVPGGWIYRTEVWSGRAKDGSTSCLAIAMVFVPFSAGIEERNFIRGVG